GSISGPLYSGYLNETQLIFTCSAPHLLFGWQVCILHNKNMKMLMKNVLILNRRCIKHPEKGGAEAYTFEFAKVLIEQGYRVEWFSSLAEGLKGTEEIAGITFIRKGNELTTHFHGFLYALKRRG